MVRSMLFDSGDSRLWGEACSTAVYLRNCLPHSQLPLRKTLFEVLFNKKPSITHLRHFASSCNVHIPEEGRPAGKFNSRAERARLIGYIDSSETIYKVILENNHIFAIRAANCTFLDSSLASSMPSTISASQPPIPSSTDRPSIESRPTIPIIEPTQPIQVSAQPMRTVPIIEPTRPIQVSTQPMPTGPIIESTRSIQVPAQPITEPTKPILSVEPTRSNRPTRSNQPIRSEAINTDVTRLPCQPPTRQALDIPNCAISTNPDTCEAMQSDRICVAGLANPLALNKDNSKPENVYEHIPVNVHEHFKASKLSSDASESSNMAHHTEPTLHSLLAATAENEPKTFNQAITCADSPKWYKAMEDELKILADQAV